MKWSDFTPKDRATMFAAFLTAVGGVIAAVLGAQIAARSEAESAARSQVSADLDRVQPRLEAAAANTARRVVQYEIERLTVSCADTVSAEGRVKFAKGLPFTAGREPEGRFRVNFAPGAFREEPIVVATPVDSQTLVNVLDVDRTGFSLQGVSPSGSKAYATFSFIAVEPERE